MQTNLPVRRRKLKQNRSRTPAPIEQLEHDLLARYLAPSNPIPIELPYMPIDVLRSLAETRFLSIEERGCYWTLLMAAWINGGYLPDDDEWLASIVDVSLSKWIKLRPSMLRRLFSISDGHWFQQRQVDDIKKIRGWIAKKAEWRRKRAPSDQRFFMSDEWQSLRKATLNRYGRRCMRCGETDGSMHVDHIKPRSRHPLLELDPDNMQVLCKPCNVWKSNVIETDFRPRRLTVR